MFYNITMDIKRILKQLLSYVKVVVVTWVTVFIVANFVFRPVIVEGRSMYPTLHDQDIGIANIIGLKVMGVKRFDIVVIDLDEYDNLLVKRVIGLPNEKVEFKDDKLYIDDVYLEEGFLDDEYKSGYQNKGQRFTDDFSIQLGEDEYFCMGDNRPHSSDCRRFGPVNFSQFVCKQVFIFYPFKKADRAD